MKWQVFVNIASVGGTLVGIAGLIISIIGLIKTNKTLKKTEDIESKIQETKIKIAYPDKHKEFANALKMAIESLEDGEKEQKSVKPYIVNDLLKLGKTLQEFNDSWPDSKKESFHKFIVSLENISSKDNLDDKGNLNDEAIKSLKSKLYDINSILERESVHNDIR